MLATVLDSRAKETLRKTVRGLRGRLLEQLEEAAKGEYRLDLKIEKARLPEARHLRRERLEAWLDEQSRAAGKGKNRNHFKSAVKEAAHTLLNRLVLLRILEHHGVLAPAMVTGGWSSPAYEQEFAKYAGPLTTDDTRGYQALLEVVFAELALELPGLFGHVGLTALFPIPAAMLREVVEALNDPALDTAWGDDTTLGWVYQYWNDPEREDLDKKIADGGQGGAARDREQDADVHGALHGRVAAPEQFGAHLVVHLQEERLDGGRRGSAPGARRASRGVAGES